MCSCIPTAHCRRPAWTSRHASSNARGLGQEHRWATGLWGLSWRPRGMFESLTLDDVEGRLTLPDCYPSWALPSRASMTRDESPVAIHAYSDEVVQPFQAKLSAFPGHTDHLRGAEVHSGARGGGSRLKSKWHWSRSRRGVVVSTPSWPKSSRSRCRTLPVVSFGRWRKPSRASG